MGHLTTPSRIIAHHQLRAINACSNCWTHSPSLPRLLSKSHHHQPIYIAVRPMRLPQGDACMRSAPAWLLKKRLSPEMLRAPSQASRLFLLPARIAAPTPPPSPTRASTSTVPSAVLSQSGSPRYKRYSAFDAELDRDALAVARRWHESFDASQLPAGSTTYARSSGPGGQHVNKYAVTRLRLLSSVMYADSCRTETKAISVYPVKDILDVIPPILHPSIRLSAYYTAGNDSLTFQAQTSRSRTANAEENRKKLLSEITAVYDKTVPLETGSDKHAKYKEV